MTYPLQHRPLCQYFPRLRQCCFTLMFFCAINYTLAQTTFFDGCRTAQLVGSVYKCSSLANNGDTVYASSYGWGMFRSIDYGWTWQPLNNGIDDPFMKGVVVVNGEVYAYSSKAYRLNTTTLAWEAVQKAGISMQQVVGDGQYWYGISQKQLFRWRANVFSQNDVDTVYSITQKFQTSLLQGDFTGLYAQTRNDAHSTYTPKGLYAVTFQSLPNTNGIDTVLFYSADQGRNWRVFLTYKYSEIQSNGSVYYYPRSRLANVQMMDSSIFLSRRIDTVDRSAGFLMTCNAGASYTRVAPLWGGSNSIAVIGDTIAFFASQLDGDFPCTFCFSSALFCTGGAVGLQKATASSMSDCSEYYTPGRFMSVIANPIVKTSKGYLLK